MNGTLASDAVTVAPTAAEACFHCGLEVPPALVSDQSVEQFCCAGCQVAYETIRGCGLDDYYALRERFGAGSRPPAASRRRYAAYDSEAFLAQHSTATAGGLAAIELRLEGVHCAACVWLVERLPHVVPGVVEARLSLGSARARVVWDPARVPLSEVAAALERLGYPPYPARDVSARVSAGAADRRRLVNVAIAGALAGNNMLLAASLYAGMFDGIEPQFARLFRALSLGVGWLSLVGPGRAFFRGAAAAWRARAVNLDLPIALALAVGGVAGTVNVLLDRGEVYFDSLSALVFLLLVGRFLQARQQRWASEAVGLMLSMTPDACRVVRDGSVHDESIDALRPGDVVEVRAGELFPADGVVVAGESAADVSLLTGESVPTPIAPGDAVCAGAQNVAATLRVRVDAVGEGTRVGKLVRMVEDGLAAKPPIVQWADRVAGWFVLVVGVLAAANLAWWSATRGVGPAIDATVALLIVACPCALGLATPLTMAVAIGRGAKRGMLIKSAAALERLATVGPGRPGRLLLDKTGTLTTGQLAVVAYHGDDNLRRWVAAIEAESNHPVAGALLAALGPAAPEDQSSLLDRREKHGFGVAATTPLGRLVVGSPRYAADQGAPLPPALDEVLRRGQASGLTVVLAAVDGQARAAVCLRDRPHAGCRAQLALLAARGWRPEILSGDAPGPVRDVAAAVGIDSSRAHAHLSPEEKLARVNAATAADSQGVVMMVGDGVNDAAALAAAHVGVAVRGGAEASLSAADVYLADGGVGRLVELIELSRRTRAVMRRNLAISVGYNAVAVALAIAGWITPLAAAVLMPLSSLSVLASATSLRAPGGGKGDVAP